MEHKQHWLSTQSKQKQVLRQLCDKAVRQQINKGDIPATQLRNRRRFLARKIIKRMPCTRLMSPNQFLHSATLVLAMWGLSGVIAPSQAFAEPLFKHELLNGFDVGEYATPSFVDIDNDGDLDVFVGEDTGTVKFYRNTGSVDAPVFSAEVGATNPLNGFDVGGNAVPSFVDIDNDGDLDAVVGERTGTVKFYRNTGSASAPVFSAEVGATNPLNGVAVGGDAVPSFVDIDNDGDLDAFVGAFDGSVNFYRNDGSVSAPVFNAVVGKNNPLNGVNVGSYSAPSFVDIDNDGDLDAFVGERYGTVKFYRNTNSANVPVFNPEVGATNPLNGVYLYRTIPSFVDIDNDGDLDVFVGETYGSMKFYRNTGSVSAPVFNPEVGVNNPLNGFDVGNRATPSFVDIDNDGDLDAFVGKYNGNVNFYRNNGSVNAPAFSAEVGVNNPLDGFDVGFDAAPSFVDIDNDGDLDAFVGENSGTVKFYRNTGSVSAPVFSTEAGATNPLNGFDVGNTATPSFVDIDNDGDLDAFVGESTGTVKFYRNTGSASAPVLSAEVGATNPLNGFDVGRGSVPSFVDIDNDGDLDAFVGERYGNVKFYRNTGSASAPVFSAEAGATNPLNGFGVGSRATPSFVDIDNDGDLDVFVGEYHGMVNFFENFDVQTLTLPAGAGDLRVQVSTAGASIPSESLTVGTLVNPPEGNFPFGKISYNVNTVAGGTVSVRMVFPSALPTDFNLYKIDAADNFTVIANTQYTQVDATTIALTLTDGGPLDLDGDNNNGVIVDPVTAGTPTPVADPVTTPVVSGGGGGAINPWSLLIFVGALLARRRRK